jgi:signal transduction histidine kinase
MKKHLLTLPLKSESDVVLARRRARQLALILGFNSQDRTRISTAVSEIVRNAYQHALGGQVEFSVFDSIEPYTFSVVVSDQGPGIKNVESMLDESSDGKGLRGAKRLMDALNVTTVRGEGTTVRLDKILSMRTSPFSENEIKELTVSLNKVLSSNPIEEVHQQNQELIVTLEQLSQNQAQLDELNRELKQKNEDLMQLNAEVQELNSSLEEKVAARTNELAGARDVAVLANELKSQFIANVSHEIRTPMTGILGLSELLMSETEGEIKETATHIYSSSLVLMNLVNDLLDMSKLEAGKMDIVRQNFKIDDLFNGVVKNFSVSASSKNLRCEYVIDERLPETIWGASDRIGQVLQNLTQNAIKFSDEGTVRLSAEQISRSGASMEVKFAVQDDGPGISTEDQKKLFKLFVQLDGSLSRRHSGTGLGLSLSKNLVDLMNGSIGVDSEPGKGSKFWFIVPLTEEHAS